MRYSILILSCLTLMACGTARQQAASDAIAGVDAMVVSPDQRVRTVVGEGVKANVETVARRRRADLPAPLMQPDEILESPTTYREVAEERRDRSMSGILGWVLGGLTLGLAGLRVSGLGGPIVSGIASMLENSARKRAKEQAEACVVGFERVIQTIERLPSDGTIGDLKKRIHNAVPPEVEAAIQRVLEEYTSES